MIPRKIYLVGRWYATERHLGIIEKAHSGNYIVIFMCRDYDPVRKPVLTASYYNSLGLARMTLSIYFHYDKGFVDTDFIKECRL